MSDIAISVQHIGKRYKIGGPQSSYSTLRESLVDIVNTPVRWLTGKRRRDEYFWALNDVSFDVKQGEVLGIIGRNGAGKSTLLKILSRITRPTSGRVELYGRVGSLLEVGTGFHPELTGRENIYLNGAILGMSRSEIRRKFDEIVDFAEIERFLDTPVKYYSSGMYVRLAFAVAAHLEPEILVVDEVLAVGDAKFQKKSLGKMESVAKQGRTVLFVSHQMNAVRTLCVDTLLLSKGKIVTFGRTNDVISEYLDVDDQSNWSMGVEKEVSSPYFTPTRMSLVNKSLQLVDTTISANQEIGVLIEGEIQKLNQALTIGFAVYAANGELLFWSLHTDEEEEKWLPLKQGINRVVGWIPPHFLNEGSYRIELILSLHYTEWISQPGVNAPGISLRIRGELSNSPYWILARPGLNAPILSFEALDSGAVIWG